MSHPAADLHAAQGPESSAAENNRDNVQRWDYAIVAALFLAALVLRLYHYRFHDVISVDGTGFVGAARMLASGDISGLSFYGLYPLLTWLANLVVRDLETAAQLVSVVMGSLLVIPLYLLGMRFFSRSTAIAAVIVTVVWPSHLFASSMVGGHATYTTLALAGVVLVRRMFDFPSPANGFWAGLCIGLAFLTRPEAFLLAIVVPLSLLLGRENGYRTLKDTLVAYCSIFVLILFLNTLLIHHVTGTWQLAAKTSSALIDTLSEHLKLSDLNKTPGIKDIGYLDIVTKYPDLLLTNPVKNLKTMYQTIMPPALWLLALLGFVSGPLRRVSWSDRLFLLSTFAPLAVIVVFYYISPGYVEPFLPVLFLWCAEGAHATVRFSTGLLASTCRRATGGASRLSPALILASAVYAVVLAASQLPEQQDLSTYRWQEDGGRRDHKNLGLMLKDTLPPGKIMTRWPRLAYYTGRDSVTIPQTNFDGIMKTAEDNGARFLVLDGLLHDVRPQLAPLLAPLRIANGTCFLITPHSTARYGNLRPYLVYTKPGSAGVIVYEVLRRAPS